MNKKDTFQSLTPRTIKAIDVYVKSINYHTKEIKTTKQKNTKK